MTRTFWVLPLAMFGIAIGCESLPGDGAGARGVEGSDTKDPELGKGDDASCGDDALDAQGCSCAPGSLPRACLSGNDGADLDSCTFGTQACETTKDSEFETSAWGACTGSVCKDGSSGGGDQNATDCCSQELYACVAAGEPEALCAELDGVCRDQTCEEVIALCPPTDIPVSAPCARAYQECFGFMVNKCERMSYSNCVGQIGDAALCTQWDASCAARELYCADLLGIAPCDQGEGEGKDCEDGPGDNLLYRCTDWGHEFQPCWQPYVDCGIGVQSCKSAFEQCQNAHSMGQTCNAPPDGDSKEHEGDDGKGDGR